MKFNVTEIRKLADDREKSVEIAKIAFGKIFRYILDNFEIVKGHECAEVPKSILPEIPEGAIYALCDFDIKLCDDYYEVGKPYKILLWIYDEACEGSHSIYLDGSEYENIMPIVCPELIRLGFTVKSRGAVPMIYIISW